MLQYRWMSLAALLMVASVVGTSAQVLSFGIEGGPCRDAFDTGTGEYVRRVTGDRVARTQLQLSAEVHGRLRQLATEAELFSYPERYVPKAEGIVMPTTECRVVVRSGSEQRTIHWRDHGSEVGDAVRLRRFIHTVYAQLAQQPEVVALPKQEAFCF